MPSSASADIAATRVAAARAPTRIDFGGGWTDVPPYCERESGFVCNIAISRHAVARVAVGSPATQATGSVESEAPLVRAVLKRAGAAASGLTVSVTNDFPVAAGLGGSSAASAALLGALAAWRGATWDPADIAEEGRRIEVEELGVAGGRQDHYAATHGGALALTFTDRVEVRRLSLGRDTGERLVARSLLVYTGESRISGDTITAVLGAYERGDARVVNALARMRALARQMAEALETGDLDGLGALVGEHWDHQRSLHPSIPTPRIDEIVSRARRAGALGAKATGASGGGCVYVMAGANNVDAVREAIRDLGDVLPFGLDARGLTAIPATA